MPYFSGSVDAMVDKESGQETVTGQAGHRLLLVHPLPAARREENNARAHPSESPQVPENPRHNII